MSGIPSTEFPPLKWFGILVSWLEVVFQIPAHWKQKPSRWSCTPASAISGTGDPPTPHLQGGQFATGWGSSDCESLSWPALIFLPCTSHSLVQILPMNNIPLGSSSALVRILKESSESWWGFPAVSHVATSLFLQQNQKSWFVRGSWMACSNVWLQDSQSPQ